MPLHNKIIKAGGDLISLIPKIVLGASQKRRAKNLQRSNGFDYVAPELLQNQSLAEQAAYSNRSFNQGVDEANNRKLAAGGQYVAGQTGSVAKRLAGSAMSTNNYLNRQLQLRERGRNERLRRVDKFMNVNAIVGNVKAQNEQRFQDTKEALLGASQQNIYGGISHFGDSLGQNADMSGSKVDPTKYNNGVQDPNMFGFKVDPTKYNNGVQDPNSNFIRGGGIYTPFYNRYGKK